MRALPSRAVSTVQAVVLLLLAAAVPLVQTGVDRRLGRFRAQKEVAYMWTGRQLKRASPGFHGLLADIYWLRTVQYFGGQHAFAKEHDFAPLDPLIDATVTLDPRLEIAYRYGSIFLAEPAPIGAGRPRAAIALLERGVRANPGNWRLRKELGYFHFLFLHDARTAARILNEAADLPGAAYWLRSMAADFLSRGGDRQNARALWNEIYQSSEGAIRQNAATHLRLLEARDTQDMLQRLVNEFKDGTGRFPSSLGELAARGIIRQVPSDPAGVPFVYDASSGHVSVDRSSPLWRADP